MSDELAKRFAENVYAIYGFGTAFLVVGIVLILWRISTDEASETVKVVSVIGVIGGLLLFLSAFYTVPIAKRACQNGTIADTCFEDLHLQLPTPGLFPTPRASFPP